MQSFDENSKGDFIQQEQDLLLEKKKFPLNLLNSFLVCGICDGYFRFAHTITECGHTFCKICIHDYIAKNQNNKDRRKCPSCKGELEIHLSKSIRKDPYKQQMVDLLYPQFAKQEQLIVKRVKELFPLIDLEFLLDEFNYENLHQQQYQRKNQNMEAPKLNLKMVVEQYLNVSFDKFLLDLYEENSFEKMKIVLLEKYPDFYKKQIEQTLKDQNESNSESLDEESNSDNVNKDSINGKRKSNSSFEQQVQKKKQINVQQYINNNYPFKVANPTSKALDVFRVSTMNQRYKYISGKSIKSLLENDDSLFKFYVNPLTNSDYDLTGLQNILRLNKDSKYELTLKHVKSFLVKKINSNTEKKNIKLPITIRNNNINLYFNELLLCDINTPLKNIHEQTGKDLFFIFDYEIVIDSNNSPLHHQQ